MNTSNVERRLPLKSGDEHDVVDARRYYHWRSGQCSKVKRQLRRRERRAWTAEIAEAQS